MGRLVEMLLLLKHLVLQGLLLLLNLLLLENLGHRVLENLGRILVLSLLRLGLGWLPELGLLRREGLLGLVELDVK